MGGRSSVARVTVKLSGPANFQTETDDNGEYVFTAVPPGSYEVSASAPGFEVRQTLQIGGGEIHFPLELKPTKITNTVVVKSSEADQRDAAPSETISETTLRDAPNVDERFESSLPLIPGVVRGPDGHVNLKGTRNTQSGALVNSANVTDPVTGSPAMNLPVDVVASVQVISNPYDPQYGRFTGAVSTVETKTSDYENFHYLNPEFHTPTSGSRWQHTGHRLLNAADNVHGSTPARQNRHNAVVRISICGNAGEQPSAV